ncbi:MAG: gliding motility-associated-like protein, partial [Salibacteraceae bacterium]
NGITFTAVDSRGNSASKTVFVTVVDSIKPALLTKDTTLYLDANGTASLDSLSLDNGTNDACGLASIGLSKYAFDCDDLGSNGITFTAVDSRGNSASKTVFVTVVDSIKPALLTKDTTLYLDVNGTASLDSLSLDNGTNDACGLASIGLSKYAFDCDDLGTNGITFTAVDVNTNSASKTVFVTVVDSIKPNLLTHDTTLYLDANGTASLDSLSLDNGTNDACGLASIGLSKYAFDCDDLGTNGITFTAVDSRGNSASKTVFVTVVDSIKPILLTHDTTMYLDSNGVASLDSLSLNSGTNDACQLESIGLSKYAFDCDDLGTNGITFTAVDSRGNSASKTVFVTVLDSIKPNLLTQDNNLYLDGNGMASLDSLSLDNGTNDACQLASIGLSKYAFDCDDLGTNGITFTAVDSSGNSASKTVFVTVLDTVKPVVNTKDITIYLDSLGTKKISAKDIDDGSWDNCGIGLLNVDLTDIQLNCSHTNLDYVLVTLYAEDLSGNSAVQTAKVFVLDTFTAINAQILTNNICEEENLSFTTVSAQSYTWTGPNGFFSKKQSPLVTRATLLDGGTYYLSAISSNGCRRQDSVIAKVKPKPIIKIDKIQNVACYNEMNGSIEVTVTNGTDFTYLWNDNESEADIYDLEVGTYFMTAINNEGCISSSDTIEIKQPSVLNLTTQVTNVSCFDYENGEILTEVNGGNGGYSYYWTNEQGFSARSKDLSRVSAGSYQLTVIDAKNCEIVAFESVIQPTELVVELFSPKLYLDFEISSYGLGDGSIIAEVSGGRKPYTINWSTGETKPSINNLKAGDYYVEIHDSLGCSVTDQINLNQPVIILFATALTPNEDGINDYFIIQGVKELVENNLMILDQFGGMVFEQNNYQNNWNGLNMKGKKVPNGTYFYVFQYNGNQVVKGHITLKRQQ